MGLPTSEKWICLPLIQNPVLARKKSIKKKPPPQHRGDAKTSVRDFESYSLMLTQTVNLQTKKRWQKNNINYFESYSLTLTWTVNLQTKKRWQRNNINYFESYSLMLTRTINLCEPEPVNFFNLESDFCLLLAQILASPLGTFFNQIK